MSSVIRIKNILSPQNLRCVANISTSTLRCSDDPGKALSQKEAPIISKETAVSQPVEQRPSSITVEGRSNIAPVSGIPEEHIKTRRVRIYMPTKNAMQSGIENTKHWQADFDNRERWENPLMGWCSSGDPHSNLELQFATKDEAIEYCEKYGYQWFIQQPPKEKEAKPKSYAINFSWNRRTRVSTK